jgi:hypothetical protein
VGRWKNWLGRDCTQGPWAGPGMQLRQWCGLHASSVEVQLGFGGESSWGCRAMRLRGLADYS